MEVQAPTALEVETFEVEEAGENHGSNISITRASVSRAEVPIATVAETIAPKEKHFTTPSEIIDRIEEDPPSSATKSPKKGNFLVNFLNSRGKNKNKSEEKNVNNNGLSMSDIVSAVKSISKSKSSKKSSEKIKIKAKCC